MAKFLQWNSVDKVYEELEEEDAAAASNGDLFDCPVTVAVGQAVYISGDNFVAPASAEAGPGQTPDAIGIVVSKPSSDTCKVLGKGLSPPIFSGLVTGTTYYVSGVTAGAITNTPPTITEGAKVQEVGQAASPTKLFIDVDSTSIGI